MYLFFIAICHTSDSICYICDIVHFIFKICFVEKSALEFWAAFLILFVPVKKTTLCVSVVWGKALIPESV